MNHAFIAALDALCAQHGVSRALNGDRIVLIDDNGSAAQGRLVLRMYGAHYGLTEEDYGTEIISKGKRMRLVGLNTNAPKYPLQMLNVADGQVWRFPRSFVPQIVARRQSKPAAPATPPAAPQVTPRSATVSAMAQTAVDATAGMPQF